MDVELENWLESRIRVVKVTGHRTRPWADIWRIEASDGLWWLKVNKAGTVHEPALLRLLGRLGSPLVPPAHTHPDEPWCLIADAGTPVSERLAGVDRATTVAFWSDLLAGYGDLQRRTGPDELRTIGLVDDSPARLPERYAELCDQQAWFDAPAVDLDPAARARIRSLGDQIAAAAEELAAGVSPTVQHDDLHDDNVLIASTDLSDPRVIDWGDAVIAHPFSTLRLTLDTLREELPGPDVEAAIDAITSAYLEGWRTDGRTEADLRRQLELARWLECVSRSAGWMRALGSVDVGLAEGFAGAPVGWLQMMADEAPSIRTGR